MWPHLHVHRTIACFHLAWLSDSYWHRFRPLVSDSDHGSPSSCCIRGCRYDYRDPLLYVTYQATYLIREITRANIYPVFQVLGAAIFVSSGESIFSNVLISSLHKTLPTVEPLQVIAAGATGLREVFPAEVLSGIMACYMDGLSATFLMAAILASCAALVSFFAPWVSIKGKTGMAVV
jgi:hypothetical protein